MRQLWAGARCQFSPLNSPYFMQVGIMHLQGKLNMFLNFFCKLVLGLGSGLEVRKNCIENERQGSN